MHVNTMNEAGNQGGSVTVALPEPARALHRRLHRMPKPARQFAFNMIEIMKGNVTAGPRMGDHHLQDPKRFLRVQLERFEDAMKADACPYPECKRYGGCAAPMFDALCYHTKG